MKKFSLLLIFILMFALAGCNKTDELEENQYRIYSDSMSPIIEKGDIVEIDDTAYEMLRVNDMIVYKAEEDQIYAGRIIEIVYEEEVQYLIVKADKAIAESKIGEENYVGLITAVIRNFRN